MKAFKNGISNWMYSVVYSYKKKDTPEFQFTHTPTHSCVLVYIYIYICFWRDSPQRARASSFTRFLDHAQRRTTVGRTPLDQWSTRRRYLYLTTHNTHNRQTSIPPGGIRTYDLSRQAAAHLRLRPPDHWNRHLCVCVCVCVYIYIYISGK
jgi:hypothetical protein